jgi:hypothetical protein
MKATTPRPLADVTDYVDGRDEMNLIEFPLSAVADRFLDGHKTVVFSDRVWDRDRREHLPRELAISGSDRYGLPTAKDEDVLLGCLQLTRLGEFRSREVEFSRYELLRLLRWSDDSKSYRRLATSLRRWKGVTLYSDRAFYDHGRKSWVNRDFGVFDNLYLYERESATNAAAPARSWFVWNEVFFDSFQAGYLKRLDWNLYCRLKDPVAKRLYRLLDKRFYHDHDVVFDLQDLAVRKIRLSPNYNTAQIKRALANGIRELETVWELRQLPPARRFVKGEGGRWQAVFPRRTHRQVVRETTQVETQQSDLAIELTRREIGPSVAEDLVAAHPAETIQTMLELFDWYNRKGQTKGAGFLVDSIRHSSKYRFPPGFESSVQRAARKALVGAQEQAQARKRVAREQRQHATESARQAAFLEFWSDLDEYARTDFEIRALTAAAPLKRSGYHRLRTTGGPAFEQYRQVILRDYFEQTRAHPAA